VVLSAVDPASPWGGTLPWPPEAAGRLQRAAGAHVVLVDGALVAYASREARELTLFLPEHDPARTRTARAAAAALAAWALRTGRTALGWGSSEPTLAESPLAPYLAAAGFVRHGPGFRVRLDAAVAGRAAPAL
jgi:ATP-dependent Lhr-like helicase